MSGGFATLAPGMEVLGSDAHHIGRIKEVNEHDFLLRRRLQPTVHVPLDAVTDVTPKGVMLGVTAGEVDEMWWVHAGEDMRMALMNLYD